MSGAWTLRYGRFDPLEEGRREALCTLGNGYLATRGAAPESVADGIHYPGSYLAGCYNRLHSQIDGVAREDESLVNIPNWLPVAVAVADGDWLSVESTQALDHEQWLDIRRGVLHRRVRFRDSQGRITLLRQRRFVHMLQPHLAGLSTSVTAENWSGELRIRSEIDGNVANTGVARYRDLSSQHLQLLSSEVVDQETMLLVARTNQSGIAIATAARTRLVSGGQLRWRPLREPGRIGHQLEMTVEAGDRVTVEKIVAVYTSQDRAIAEPASAAVAAVTDAPDFTELRRRHQLAWDHLWRRFQIHLADTPAQAGGEEALRTVRLHLFHVLQTASPHSADLDVGVPARGLHGEAYRGHVFWDELFVLPVLNLRLPTLTRSLLRYRWRRLAQARRAAATEGYAGAMYPWQSGSDGREESQRLHLNPLSGHWLPDPTFRQRHIGLAVAYNVWQYYQVTGNIEFLGEYGAEMILEIARFFASLSRWDAAKRRYVIRGVVGPDEFHTGYPGGEQSGVDNNAYTNVMAVWVLERALETLRLLPEWRRAELTETLDLRAEETRRWQRITRRMFVPFHSDGIMSQFEGYERLTELDWKTYRKEYGDIQRLDRILEAEGDSVNRYQASKQADVLMLFYLLTSTELTGLLEHLGYRLSADAIPRTVDYYLARTSHGSTLSAVVHAWVLARLHREQALEHFVRALSSDVADIQGGTTAEGIHLAAMAGSVDLLERCFTGISLRHDTLWLDPFWPEQLGALELTVRYRDLPLTIEISDGHVTITAGSGPGSPIRVCCNGASRMLAPGSTVTMSRR
jgi:trehalose/maltose hydrolase-like predicted phosphorylase